MRFFFFFPRPNRPSIFGFAVFFIFYFRFLGAVLAAERSAAPVVCHYRPVIFPVIDTFGLVSTVIKSAVFPPLF